jgi:hypothetical protein
LSDLLISQAETRVVTRGRNYARTDRIHPNVAAAKVYRPPGTCE